MTAMWEMDFIILNILRRKDERERERHWRLVGTRRSAMDNSEVEEVTPGGRVRKALGMGG
jgi:hypothetical protein